MKTKHELAVIVLAAGKGTRMKSSLPKVMHKIAGLPMISHVIRAAEKLKPAHIITVIAPGMDDVAAAAAPHLCAVQKTQKGTGDAVKSALPYLKNFQGDVLILLGDMPLIRTQTLKSLIAARRKNPDIGLAVLGVHLDDPTGYGRMVLNDDGTLDSIIEHKDASAAQKQITLVNTGAFCVDGAELPKWIGAIQNKNAQGEFYITDLPAIAARAARKTAVVVADDAGEVRGCNTRADLAALEYIAQTRLRAASLDGGVTMTDPETVYFSWDTKIGADTVIEPHVVFGPGVSIESGVAIRAFSHIEGASIGKGASIGPFARLRPGAKIGEGAKIGNFVEIKKSAIGARSKIGHLAYVGDTDMGEDVNFSAGAITVNYDGFNKHKTGIGSGAMIGSNVNLVAPVTIGKGAYIAAGSTVAGDVPQDALFVARERGVTKKSWAKNFRAKNKKGKGGKK